MNKPKTVFKSFKCRIYPTDSQKVLLSKHFGCSRFVYNYFLNKKKEIYEETKKGLSYSSCCSLLTALKKDDLEWLKEVNSQSLQQSLINLEEAFGNFFKKRSKFPTYKKKSKKQSFRVPQSISLANGFLKIPKFREGIKVNLHRPLGGKIKSVTISKTPTEKYFVSFLCETEVKEFPKTQKSIGLDLGITDFLVTSEGQKTPNPKFNKSLRESLSKSQKHLSRKTRGSNRYQKQKIKVAKIHEKITNSRNDFQHKLSLFFVKEYDVIAVETLSISKMLKNKHLSYSISDAGWYSFVEKLKYKADWYGKKVSEIDPFYPSSKTCSCCGNVVSDLPLNIRSWKCPSCLVEHDRDINAAKNIYRQGLSITNVEREALVFSNSAENETSLNEALKPTP